MNRLLKHFKGDPVIWAMLTVLAVVSILVVYSATGTLAYSKYHGETFRFLLKQLFFVFSGIAIAYVVHLLDLRFYQKLSKLLVWFSIPLLLVTMAMGSNLNDAARWISIGGITFQSSDFAKVALIMYVAHMLAAHQNDIKEWTVYLKIIAVVGVICLIILPNNFSTAAMLGMVCVILMFIGRVSTKHILLTGVGAVVLFVVFVLIAQATGIQKHRIATWEKRYHTFVGDGKTKKPTKDDTFQADQSKIAVATGGVFGKGPGNSTQRNYLPHPYSDFIFAIIIEEYGLIGGFVILMIYLALLYRAGIIVKKTDKTFPAFLTMGLILLLVIQAMINMGVAVGVFPVTGQTLPFVSMGGSSIWMTGAVFGLIQSATRKIVDIKPAEKEKVEQSDAKPEKEPEEELVNE
ncbi:FtsW/RodA/SpoVE family cell cycle protein [uncultured Acetobacteroides sp.]|uniref:FtsW/RodA/SpoVE family cell cycle protein n=1 Tax=uncultured Acetobacteroides sp. TaxID=1760811 RepID=UPI00374870E0